MSSHKQSGFTLIEMLIAFAILATLSALAYPSYTRFIQKSRMEQGRSAITENIQALERFYAEYKTFKCDSNTSNHGFTCNQNPITGTKRVASIAPTPESTDTRKNPHYSNIQIIGEDNGNAYSIVARPDSKTENLAGGYKQLTLVYHSKSGSFAKCVSIPSNYNFDDSNNGCEIFY